MAKKEDLQVGQHVSFLRMSNKAVRLTGTIERMHEDDARLVDVQLDGHDYVCLDTAHVDDVTVLPAETPEGNAAELRGDGIDATVTSEGVEVKIP